MVKNTIKLCRKLILHKIYKNMKRKPGVKCFVYSRVWRHLRQIQTLQLHNLVKTDQNTTESCKRFVLHKINKDLS